MTSTKTISIAIQSDIVNNEIVVDKEEQNRKRRKAGWLFCYITSVIFLFVPSLLNSYKVDKTIKNGISSPDASLLVFSTLCGLSIELFSQKKNKSFMFTAIILIVSLVSYCGIESNNNSFFYKYRIVLNIIMIVTCFIAGTLCYSKGE